MATWKHRLTEINPGQKRGVCQECGPVGLKRTSRGTYRCIVVVREENRRYRGPNTSHSRGRNYGMTGEEYDLFKQGACEVCGTDENLCIDHDHSCCPGKTSCGGCVRGVLCSNCNTAEGFLRSDPERAEALARYLRK